jgi:hypothetical protein
VSIFPEYSLQLEHQISYKFHASGKQFLECLSRAYYTRMQDGLNFRRIICLFFELTCLTCWYYCVRFNNTDRGRWETRGRGVYLDLRKREITRELKLNSVALVREQTMPTERPPLVGEVVPTFADRGCRVASATDFHGR